MTDQQLLLLASLEARINECPQKHMAHLLDLVQSYDWPAVLCRLISHPHEASSRGPHGRTALHMACDHDAPASVIRALLKAYPDASSMVGTSDMNPLHITCSSQHASVEVVKVLLEGSPTGKETRMRDVDGDTALHTACRCGAPIEVLEVLLKADPSAVDKRDYEGLTPLLRLWVRYYVTLGDDVIMAVQGSHDLVGMLGEAWEKTILLLRYAHIERLYPNRKGLEFSPLHAAAAVDCPRAVLKICKKLYPSQLNAKDEFGRTPLLIAINAPIYKVHDLSVDGYNYELLDDLAARDEVESDDSHNGSHHESLSTEIKEESSVGTEPSVIETILQDNESAARVKSRNGRLALNMAIISGKSWNEGVKLLMRAHPDGLSLQDPSTHLYPFMLAAVGNLNTLTTVYELLRAGPELAQEGIMSKDEIKKDIEIITKSTKMKPSSSLPSTSCIESRTKAPTAESVQNKEKKILQSEYYIQSESRVVQRPNNRTSEAFSNQCSISSECRTTGTLCKESQTKSVPNDTHDADNTGKKVKEWKDSTIRSTIQMNNNE